MTNEINSNNNDRWWIAALITVLLLWFLNAFWNPTRAQKLDTLQINPSCIEKVIQKQTPKTVRYYAVYNDSDISELIPISKTVLEYMQTCKENGLRPNLGIKFKDGQIVSIIKYKKTYVKTRSVRKR